MIFGNALWIRIICSITQILRGHCCNERSLLQRYNNGLPFCERITRIWKRRAIEDINLLTQDDLVNSHGEVSAQDLLQQSLIGEIFGMQCNFLLKFPLEALKPLVKSMRPTQLDIDETTYLQAGVFLIKSGICELWWDGDLVQVSRIIYQGDTVHCKGLGRLKIVAHESDLNFWYIRMEDLDVISKKNNIQWGSSIDHFFASNVSSSSTSSSSSSSASVSSSTI